MLTKFILTFLLSLECMARLQFMMDGSVEVQWKKISGGTKALVVAASSLADKNAVWVVTTKTFKDGEGNTIAKFDSETNTWNEDTEQPLGAIANKKKNIFAVD